jgi:hypothetical protein
VLEGEALGPGALAGLDEGGDLAELALAPGSPVRAVRVGHARTLREVADAALTPD